MFDIGLEVIRPKYEVPADWSMEQGTELFYELNTQLDAVTNLITIRQSIQKYGKTPQLMDLVGASFEGSGITFSNEGIVDSIKNFFVWIKDKIVELWKWFWGLLGFYKDEDKEIKENLNAAEEVINAVQNNNEPAIEKAKGKLKKKGGGNVKATPTTPTTDRNTIIVKSIPSDVLIHLQRKAQQITQEFMNPQFDSYDEERQRSILNTMLPALTEFKTEMKQHATFHTIEYTLGDGKKLVQHIREGIANTDKSLDQLRDQLKELKQYTAMAEKDLTSNPDSAAFKQTAEVLRLRLKATAVLIVIAKKKRATLYRLVDNLVVVLGKI